MKDKLSKIDQQILHLKQKKEKLQTQQSLHFVKESQKIFENKFSVELATHVLSQSCKTSSDQQKKEWEKTCPQGGEDHPNSFRKSSQKPRTKDNKTSTENSQS